MALSKQSSETCEQMTIGQLPRWNRKNDRIKYISPHPFDPTKGFVQDPAKIRAKAIIKEFTTEEKLDLNKIDEKTLAALVHYKRLLEKELFYKQTACEKAYQILQEEKTKLVICNNYSQNQIILDAGYKKLKAKLKNKTKQVNKTMKHLEKVIFILEKLSYNQNLEALEQKKSQIKNK